MTLTTVNPALLDTQAQYTGFKNRIINGAMVIDQRNAGAAVTNANGYTLDRWLLANGSTGAITVQQDSTAPTGFRNSQKITVATSDAVSSTEYVILRQKIEGFNTADLMWGTASAQTITISFWVRSSLTGTFGGVLANSAQNRIYPFTYTISAANTFEYKTLTIAGDTTGTWLTTNGTGIELIFGLGVGTDYSATAGAWTGSFALSATGATSVVGTSGATFYITGVQLEKGSTATSFDYRPYGTELALCQRYYYKNAPSAIADSGIASGQQVTLTISSILLTIPVPMRSAPTLTQSNLIVSDNVSYDSNVTGVDAGYFTTGTTGYANFTNNSAGAAYRPCILRTKSTGSIGFVSFSAEL